MYVTDTERPGATWGQAFAKRMDELMPPGVSYDKDCPENDITLGGRSASAEQRTKSRERTVRSNKKKSFEGVGTDF